MDYGLNAGGIDTTKVYDKYSNKYYSDDDMLKEAGDTGGDYLDFDSYLKLLVAQMSNQDFNNPMDDSEVLAQMAQYSMLEGIKNMTLQSSISYASSLVGKTVTVSDKEQYLTGVVDSISIDNNKAYLVIDGNKIEASKVTDIVDPKKYSDLEKLIGQTAIIEVDEETTIKGEITHVLFMKGEGYVAVDGKAYKLSDVTQIVDADSDGEKKPTYEEVKGKIGSKVKVYDIQGSDDKSFIGTITDVQLKDDVIYVEVDGDKAYPLSRIDIIDDTAEDKKEESDDSGELLTETSEVDTSLSYSAKSQALVDILMRELDRVDGADGVSKTNAASKVSGETTDMTDEDVKYVLQTAYIEVPDYSAAFYGDDEILTAYDLNDVDTTYGKGDVTYTMSSSVTDNVQSVSNSSIGSSSASKTSEKVNSNLSSSVSRTYGSSQGVTTKPGISTGDCVPHRISVEDYPEEAALADMLGTRMYDIRYINNHAITTRIRTGTVIGRTQSGRGITEIGYSGEGQLGEVVTFADGTQRVEILLKNGHSAWLETSGNYTLDQICSKIGTSEPGSLAGKLTPAESAIRHYSNPFSNLSSRQTDSFANYLTAQGHA